MERDEAFAKVDDELERALIKYESFKSPHEGYEVIEEELEKLWADIKADGARGRKQQRKEAAKLAAMSLRYLIDLC